MVYPLLTNPVSPMCNYFLDRVGIIDFYPAVDRDLFAALLFFEVYVIGALRSDALSNVSLLILLDGFVVHHSIVRENLCHHILHCDLGKFEDWIF